MEIENKAELQTLLNLNCRMLSLEKLAAGYKQNAKALKLCLKLIKLESKELKKCNSVTPYHIAEMQRKYATLIDIVKRLTKVSNPGAYNTALADLHKIIELTQAIVSDLNEQLNPLSENVRKLAISIDGKARKLSKKLENGTQMLSDKVNEAVDGIKKAFKGKDQNEDKTE